MFGYQSCGYEEQIKPHLINQLPNPKSCYEQRQGLLPYAITTGA